MVSLSVFISNPPKNILFDKGELWPKTTWNEAYFQTRNSLKYKKLRDFIWPIYSHIYK